MGPCLLLHCRPPARLLSPYGTRRNPSATAIRLTMNNSTLYRNQSKRPSARHSTSNSWANPTLRLDQVAPPSKLHHCWSTGVVSHSLGRLQTDSSCWLSCLSINFLYWTIHSPYEFTGHWHSFQRSQRGPQVFTHTWSEPWRCRPIPAVPITIPVKVRFASISVTANVPPIRVYCVAHPQWHQVDLETASPGTVFIAVPRQKPTHSQGETGLT